IRTKGGDGPDCNGLFADIEMKETGNFCAGVHLRRFFFEPANQQHLTIEEQHVTPVNTWHNHDEEPSRARLAGRARVRGPNFEVFGTSNPELRTSDRALLACRTRHGP